MSTRGTYYSFCSLCIVDEFTSICIVVVGGSINKHKVKDPKYLPVGLKHICSVQEIEPATQVHLQCTHIMLHAAEKTHTYVAQFQLYYSVVIAGDP